MRVHISLPVQSLEQSIRFYTGLLGAEPTKREAGYANFRLDEPAIHLALDASRDAQRRGDGHFGLELSTASQLDAWRDRLQAAGVAFLREDDAHCCYATGNKLWLTDPDGYRWEIWHRTGVFDAMSSATASQAATRDQPARHCC